MFWLLILCVLLSNGGFFSFNESTRTLSSGKAGEKGYVISSKESEATSWGAIKAIYKDDNNDSGGGKRDKGK